MARGRPTKYNKQIASRICERIATSELGLEQVLEEIEQQDGTAPGSTTIYRWLEQHREFREQSARARRMQAELLHDRAQLAAQTPLLTQTIRESEKGGRTVTTADNVERSKLLVQTMLRRAGQLDPKKYGDKVAQEVGRQDGEPVKADVEDWRARLLAKLGRT